MKLLILLLFISFCAVRCSNAPSACDYKLPNRFCLLYNDHTKKYVIRETVISLPYTEGRWIRASDSTNAYIGTFSDSLQIDTQYLYITKPKGFDENKDDLFILDRDWLLYKKTQFSDSCLAKGALKYIIDLNHRKTYREIARDSLNKIKAKQDSINNLFKPLNCK